MIYIALYRLDMPAGDKLEEGAQILFLTVPHRVVSNETGMVTHLEYIRMESNNEGKGKVIHVPSSQTLIDADLLVVTK